MGNGTPNRVIGNGEGHTCLILTDAESRLIRRYLFPEPGATVSAALGREACDAFNRGIQRGTERIKAEFDADLKRRKESKR